jgi:hypothetical protein
MRLNGAQSHFPLRQVLSILKSQPLRRVLNLAVSKSRKTEKLGIQEQDEKFLMKQVLFPRLAQHTKAVSTSGKILGYIGLSFGVRVVRNEEHVSRAVRMQ